MCDTKGESTPDNRPKEDGSEKRDLNWTPDDVRERNGKDNRGGQSNEKAEHGCTMTATILFPLQSVFSHVVIAGVT